MVLRRTTLTAEAEDLAVLAGEARRRGSSLARLLEEAVAEKAARLRSGRRPRLGTFMAEGEGIAAAMEADPQNAVARPYRS